MRVAASERIILKLLVAQGAAYGLELVKASRGKLTRGGIYVTLGRMEDKGLVRSSQAEHGRRLYKITALGDRALLADRILRGELKVSEATS